MGKYQAYPEYKDSGVEWLGEIPSHWGIIKVKHLTACLDGMRIPLNASERGEMQGNIPYWGANSIVDYVNQWLFDEDLVLVGEDGAPFFDKTKNVAFYVSGKIWPNNHVHVLRTQKEKADPKFFTYAMNNVDFHHYITGSTRDKLNQSDLNSIVIRICNLHEQQKIAAFLDHETAKIDALIEKQQQLIQLLKEKRQAVISHAVTKGLNPNAPMKDSGIEWLGEVPAHWNVACLRWFIKIASGDGLPNTNFENEADQDNPYRVIGGNGTMGFTRFLNTDREALAIGRVGALCGNVHLINESCWVTDNALKISCWVRFDSHYLYFLLNAAKLNEYASRSAQPLITGEQVKALKVVIPPIQEQVLIGKHIANELRRFSNLVNKSKIAIQLMQERRTALISAAVTGKIDVRDFVVPA